MQDLATRSKRTAISCKPSSYICTSIHSKKIFQLPSTILSVSEGPRMMPTYNSPSFTSRSSPRGSSQEYYHSRPEQVAVAEKCAVRAAESSIAAVLQVLARQGVAKATIMELRREFQEGKYFAVLKSSQEYAKCVIKNDTALEESIHYLLVGCWTSLIRCFQFQYKQAYKQFHALRREAQESRNPIQPSSTMELDRALRHQMELAELCCSCQKELILADKQHRMRPLCTSQ